MQVLPHHKATLLMIYLIGCQWINLKSKQGHLWPLTVIQPLLPKHWERGGWSNHRVEGVKSGDVVL